MQNPRDIFENYLRNMKSFLRPMTYFKKALEISRKH